MRESRLRSVLCFLDLSLSSLRSSRVWEGPWDERECMIGRGEDSAALIRSISRSLYGGSESSSSGRVLGDLLLFLELPLEGVSESSSPLATPLSLALRSNRLVRKVPSYSFSLDGLWRGGAG